LGEWSQRYGSQATKQKVYVGEITNYFSRLGVAEIHLDTNQLEKGDEFIITGPTTGVYQDIVGEIRVDLLPVLKTVKGDDCSIPVKELVRRNDKVYKLIPAEQL
jgi:putative protease